MGSLLKETFVSELISSLEALDHQGVSHEDLKRLRVDKDFANLVAVFIKTGGWAKPEAPATSDNLVKALEPIEMAATLAKWQKFCLEVFGREIDATKLVVPSARGDINFPLVVTEDLATIIAKCRERFRYWQWTDEDLSKLVKSDRTSENGAYVVLIRDVVEADEIHKRKSAKALGQAGIIGIALEERLTCELFYHWGTGGKHLDMKDVTICAGSRYTDGDVPSVHFGVDKVRVYDCRTDRYDDRLRVREVVSAAA